VKEQNIMAVSKKGGKTSASKKGAKGVKGQRGKNTILVGDPIIITGGSLNIEFADSGDDTFDPDTPATGKKKFKHRKNTGDKVRITRVVIRTKGSDDPLMEVNLDNLGKNKDCKIKIFYEILP
jgi:hypothetical protein